VLFAGGHTGVQGATIRIGSSSVDMFKVSGATWAASLSGQTSEVAEFDVTYADGTTASISIANGCFGGQWPVSTGSVCQATGSTPTAPVSAPTTPVAAPVAAPSPTAPTVPFSGDLFSTTNTLTTWEIYQGLSSLTYTASSSPLTLALVASGGVSGSGGSVVSEGQAYGLLITGIVLASWDTHAQDKSDADRQAVVDDFYGYFNGWVAMCQNNQAGGTSCQSEALCVAEDGTTSICLPDWKQSKDFSATEGTGAAPDGDQDAIVGMIFALGALANDSSKPSWYSTVAAWADSSISAFMQFNVNTDEAGFSLVKLGSCWGGWGASGQNPSYHSPGSYKIMRDYHLSYSSSGNYQTFIAAEFNTLFETSYKLLFGTQVRSLAGLSHGS
jgi:hypothetical protein